jgi:hypothetical protein
METRIPFGYKLMSHLLLPACVVIMYQQMELHKWESGKIVRSPSVYAEPHKGLIDSIFGD